MLSMRSDLVRCSNASAMDDEFAIKGSFHIHLSSDPLLTGDLVMVCGLNNTVPTQV